MDEERLMIIGGGFIGQSIKIRYPSALLMSSSLKCDMSYPESIEVGEIYLSAIIRNILLRALERLLFKGMRTDSKEFSRSN